MLFGEKQLVTHQPLGKCVTPSRSFTLRKEVNMEEKKDQLRRGGEDINNIADGDNDPVGDSC